MTELPVPGSTLPPLFTPLQIAVASFIGGPIPACWLLARNCRTLGQQRRARHVLAWGAAGMIALIVLSLYLPASFPRVAIPVGYTIGLYQTAHQMHGITVREHLEHGGAPAPWLDVFKVSLAALLVMLLLLLGAQAWVARA